MNDVKIINTEIELPVNVLQLVDDTDSKTIKDAIVYNESGMDLNWNFTDLDGNYTQTNVVPASGANYEWKNKGNGMYGIVVPASGGGSINNDEYGTGWFSGVCDGVLPFGSPRFTFVPANTVNSLAKGTDYLQTDMWQVKGIDAETALVSDTDVQSSCDAAITANTTIGNIDTGVNNIDAGSINSAITSGITNALNLDEIIDELIRKYEIKQQYIEYTLNQLKYTRDQRAAQES